MTQYHECVRLRGEPEQTFPHDGVMTCGSCGKSWCRICDPSPASLCPYCNGAENTVSNPIIEPGIHGVTDEFVERVIFNVRENTTGWLKEQTVGTIRALQQQAQPPSARDVLVGLANEHPDVAEHIAQILRAADLPELVANVEVVAEVSQTWAITETLPIPRNQSSEDVLHDRLCAGDLLPAEHDLLSVDIEKVEVRRTVCYS